MTVDKSEHILITVPELLRQVVYEMKELQQGYFDKEKYMGYMTKSPEGMHEVFKRKFVKLLNQKIEGDEFVITEASIGQIKVPSFRKTKKSYSISCRCSSRLADIAIYRAMGNKEELERVLEYETPNSSDLRVLYEMEEYFYHNHTYWICNELFSKSSPCDVPLSMPKKLIYITTLPTVELKKYRYWKGVNEEFVVYAAQWLASKMLGRRQPEKLSRLPLLKQIEAIDVTGIAREDWEELLMGYDSEHRKRLRDNYLKVLKKYRESRVIDPALPKAIKYYRYYPDPDPEDRVTIMRKAMEGLRQGIEKQVRSSFYRNALETFRQIFSIVFYYRGDGELIKQIKNGMKDGSILLFNVDPFSSSSVLVHRLYLDENDLFIVEHL